MTPTFGISHTSPFTRDGNNYGGPTVPIGGVEAAQDQRAGGYGKRREVIRFGTPSSRLTVAEHRDISSPRSP